VKTYIIKSDLKTHKIKRKTMREAIEFKNTLSQHFPWSIREVVKAGYKAKFNYNDKQLIRSK